MSLAIVFPGQGSQSVGMLGELANAFPVVKETFEHASDALSIDLWQLMKEGPSEDLNRTYNTQPAMLAAGVAVWRVWKQKGGPPAVVLAGHSLGEYTALVCASAMDFAQTVALVADRGHYMQDAVAEGVGAVGAIIGLTDDEIHELCTEMAHSDVVQPVNFNAPGQVVVAGHAEAVNRVLEKAGALGAKRAVLLPVSVPVHSRLMGPAVQHLRARLQQVSMDPPQVPVIRNVDVEPHTTPESMREALARQLNNPVRWSETVFHIAREHDANVVLEFGPGKVLTDIGRQIDFRMRGQLGRRTSFEAVQDSKGLERAMRLATAP